MSNTNNFSLTGIGSSVRFGKGNGIIAFGTGGFGVFDSTGTVLGPVSIGNSTLSNHAITQGQVYGLIGSTALSGANGISFVNGTISALIDGSTIVLNGSNLTVGQITNSNVASGANIALNKLASVGTDNVVLVSDGSGHVSASSISTTTLGYLDATSSIQTQLNAIGTTYLPLTGGTVTGAIISTAVPTLGSQLVNKAYVDGIGAGIDAKQAVAAATTGSNILLDGSVTTLDGVTLTNGMRVLVKDQTTQTQNGIYIVSSTAWQRSTDFASGNDESGAYTFVTAGTVNHGKGFVVVGTPNVVGTNNITFTQFSEAGAYTAGSGLSINTSGVPAIFSIDLGTASGLTTSTGPLNLNIASLNAGGAINSADLVALSQSGSTVYTTVGSLAAEIAQSSVTGSGAIDVSSGVVSLVTDGEFTQSSGSLALGNITPTNIDTAGTIGLNAGKFVLFNGSVDTNWRMGIAGTSGTSLNTTTIGSSTSLQIVTGAGGTGPDGFAIGNTNGSSWFEINGSTGAVSILENVTASNINGTLNGGVFGTFNGSVNGTFVGSANGTFTGLSSGTNTGDDSAGAGISIVGHVVTALVDGTTLAYSGGSGAIYATGSFNSAVNATGTIKASNFASGASVSGTNTGDQSAGAGLSLTGGTFSTVTDNNTIIVNGGNELAVNIDGSTLYETGAGFLGVQLAAGQGLSSSGTGISVDVDGSTININGSGQLYAVHSGTGSVTSVAVAGSNGIGVSGSPITNAGTIALTLGNITPTSVTTAGTVAATGNVTGANLSGTNTGDQTITLTGDVTGSGTGSFATTLANSGVTAGSYGDSTHYPTFTVDAKGRITLAGTVSISSLGTGSVTSIVAGNGLSGGTITNSGTIAVQLDTGNGNANTHSSSGLVVNGSGLSTQFVNSIQDVNATGTFNYGTANGSVLLQTGTMFLFHATGTSTVNLNTSANIGDVIGLYAEGTHAFNSTVVVNGSNIIYGIATNPTGTNQITLQPGRQAWFQYDGYGWNMFNAPIEFQVASSAGLSVGTAGLKLDISTLPTGTVDTTGGYSLFPMLDENGFNTVSVTYDQIKNAVASSIVDNSTIVDGTYQPNKISVKVAGTGGLITGGSGIGLGYTFLPTGTAIGSSDIVTLQQTAGSVVQTTVGSLAAAIAGEAITGTNGINVTSGTASLVLNNGTYSGYNWSNSGLVVGSNGLSTKFLNTIVNTPVGTYNYNTTTGTVSVQAGGLYYFNGTGTSVLNLGLGSAGDFIGLAAGGNGPVVVNGSHFIGGPNIASGATTVTIQPNDQTIFLFDGYAWNMIVPAISLLTGTASGLTSSYTKGLTLNLATLNAGTAIGTADLIALSQGGTTVSTTIGSLAAEIASAGVSGTGAITVTSGTVGLAVGTAGGLSQSGSSLHMDLSTLPAGTFSSYNAYVAVQDPSYGLGTVALGRGTYGGVVGGLIGLFATELALNSQSINTTNNGTVAQLNVTLQGTGGLTTTGSGIGLQISNLNTAGSVNGSSLVAISNSGTTVQTTVANLVSSVVNIPATALRGNIGAGLITQTIGTLVTIGTYNTVVARVIMNVGSAFTTGTAPTASVTDGTNTYMLTSENDITTPGTYVADLPMTVNSQGKVISVTFDTAPTAGTGSVVVKYDFI